MTKRTRTILFLTFTVIFILVAPVVGLYSQGYRIDLNPPSGGKVLTQTGGIYLKVLPKQVEVYLDGELKQKTDFIFGSLLIEDLLPKKYKIEVKKAGFYSWEKTLEVKEKEVVEAKNIVLFTANPDFTVLSKNVANFWFSPDQRKIVLKEKEKNGWSLKLYETDKNVKSHLMYSTDISKIGADLMNLEFSEDSKNISLEIGMAEELKYFTISLDKTPATLQKSSKPQPLSENTVASRKINNDSYSLDNSGNLYKNEEKLTEKSFPVKKETEYSLEVFSNFIFLKEGQTLYRFNSDSRSFEKFFDGIKDLKVSPDSRKLAYFSDNEIWVLFLEDIMSQPQKKAGDKLFLVRLSEKIDDIFWLNSDYLTFNSGDKVKIGEIDDRDKINIMDMAEFKNPDFFWGQYDKKLYILSKENLYRSDILFP
ncbi:MAG: hypothetical protein A2175_00780 [Candidatus Nealsonbacteria bacterium RBG_13_42_11]|uniref:PEGA domain-containing protein n=1 Tax=Candidatus Nealsonbacteria bacterium RBG_13_42_11 TaxID=1801663 RepID=A0A1G2E0J0_9BACT|nr:MAG: hypothetical protein A2175_00780 [Candidatus Nealsonbacteria bacterium RBG_13_42_11]